MQKTRMTHYRRALTCWRLPASAALIVTILLLGAAPSAKADDVRISFGGSSWGYCGSTYGGRYYRTSYAERRYDYGYKAGAADGWNDGYRDGMYGRAFCPAPPRCSGRSRYYRDGYLYGYDRSYRDGYYQGKAEYQRRQHRGHRHGRRY